MKVVMRHVIGLGTGEWDAMLADSRRLPAEPVMPDYPANIQYTSVTAGSRSHTKAIDSAPRLHPICPHYRILNGSAIVDEVMCSLTRSKTSMSNASAILLPARSSIAVSTARR